MSEEFERETKPESGSGDGEDARKLLPAKTSGGAPNWFAEWVARVLDIVEMMADATRDMAVLDPYNPRSVGFQLTTINDHVATLPALHADGVPEEPQRLAARLATDLETTTAQDLDNSVVLAVEQRISNFAKPPSCWPACPRKKPPS